MLELTVVWDDASGSYCYFSFKLDWSEEGVGCDLGRWGDKDSTSLSRREPQCFLDTALPKKADEILVQYCIWPFLVLTCMAPFQCLFSDASAALMVRSVFPANKHMSKPQVCEKSRLCFSPVIPFFLEAYLMLKISPLMWFPYRGVVALLGSLQLWWKLRGSPLQMMMSAGSHMDG